MKALISPAELREVIYIAAWVDSKPQYEIIEDCQRVAEVAEDAFEVAPPLHWVDCPDDCVAEEWYYKDGLHKIPEDMPEPNIDPTPVETIS